MMSVCWWITQVASIILWPLPWRGWRSLRMCKFNMMWIQKSSNLNACCRWRRTHDWGRCYIWRKFHVIRSWRWHGGRHILFHTCLETGSSNWVTTLLVFKPKSAVVDTIHAGSLAESNTSITNSFQCSQEIFLWLGVNTALSARWRILSWASWYKNWTRTWTRARAWTWTRAWAGRCCRRRSICTHNSTGGHWQHLMRLVCMPSILRNIPSNSCWVRRGLWSTEGRWGLNWQTSLTRRQCKPGITMLQQCPL